MRAEIAPGDRPQQHPNGAAQCIEGKKLTPIHFQGAGHDTVQLPQYVEESCKAHRYRTIACEDRLDLAEPLGSQSDLAAESRYQSMAKLPADDVTDIVADDRACPG